MVWHYELDTVTFYWRVVTQGSKLEIHDIWGRKLVDLVLYCKTIFLTAGLILEILWILLITYNVCPAVRSRSVWSITEKLCCWYTLAPAWRGHALGSQDWPSLLILHKSPQSTNCQGQGVSLSRLCYAFIPLVMIMYNTQVNIST